MKQPMLQPLLAAFILLTAGLAGCGNSSSSNGVPATNSTRPGTLPVSNSVKHVSNSGLTFELEFVEPMKLQNGTTRTWGEADKQPYLDAAHKWLNALLAVEGKSHHNIRMKIFVETLHNGNGQAGPDSEEQIGDFNFATTGTIKIGNHTYAPGFDQVEFNANILHEMGHIIGIGSFTEDFRQNYAPMKGNVLKVENSIAAQKYNQIYGTHYPYVPLSDDGGHLYDYILQEDKKRVLNDGTTLPPLTKEFMAQGTLFGAVTLAVLDDIGYEVSYSGAEAYTP